MKFRLTKPAVRSSLLYALVASIWILVSDWLLTAAALGPVVTGRLAMFKGWLFVAVTTGLLYFVLRRYQRRWIAEIATRQAREHELLRLNQLGTAFNSISQQLLRAQSQAELFQAVCQTAVAQGGFKMAWIGWWDRVTQVVNPIARAGDETGYLDRITVYADDRPEGRGVVGTCIRTGQPAVFNDFLSDPRGTPWHAPAAAAGLRAVAAFPIRLAGEVVAVLTVATDKPEFFQDGAIALLDRAVAEISVALDRLAKDQQRRQLEQELLQGQERYRSLFEHMLNGFAYCRMVYENDRPVDFVYLDVNPAFEVLTGLKNVIGKKVSTVIPDIQRTNPELIAVYGHVAQTGQPSRLETYLPALKLWLSITVYCPTSDHFVAIFDNVTERKQAEAMLRLQSNALESAANAIVITDQTGTIQWVNPAFTALTGYTARETIGQNPRVLKSGRHSADFYRRLWETIAAGQVWHGELVNRRKDGSLYTEEMTITPVRTENDTGTYFVAIKQDVTARKRLESEHAITLRLLSLSNSGRSLAELLRDVTALLRDWIGCEAVGIRLRAGADFPYYTTRGFPAEFVQLESHLCPLDAAGNPVRDAAGQPILECMCGNVLSGRFDPAQPFFTARGSFWTNSTTQLLANTTAKDRQALTRNRCNSAGYESVALVALHVGQTTCGLLQINDKRPNRFTPDSLALLEQLADYLAVAIAHRQSQQQVQAANQQLAVTLDKLQTAQHQLVAQERLRALGQMASGIAHDFNNTLAPILGFTELLLKQPDPFADRSRALKYLGLIRQSAQDGAHVVRGLREFYRPRLPGETTHPVNLNDLVRQSIELTQPRWKQQATATGISIAMATDLAADLPAVAGNEASLREALTNLLFNAVDALPAGGTITFRTWVADQHVLLEVTDTGTGMTPEIRRHCLEPFFTTKGTAGTGLGLSMVHGVIRRHDGTLEIDTAPGAGTTVRLRLPINPSAAPEIASELPHINSLHILLVEDEAAVAASLAECLTGEGHRIVATSNAAEALREFAPARFDLVITDLAMPGLGGDQLAAALKQRAPAVPVILLTGFGDLLLSRNELPAGVDLVLAKPITYHDLHTALARVMTWAR